MRVICPHCHHKAFITKNNRMSGTVCDLYCRCSNIQCNAAFVFILAYKHDLSPPQTTLLEMAVALVNSLQAEEKQALQRSVF